MTHTFPMLIDGGIGDCIWEFSVLPNLKRAKPDSHIKLHMSRQKERLLPLIDGLYDELVVLEPAEYSGEWNAQAPLMFFDDPGSVNKPGSHLMDCLPRMLDAYYGIKIPDYYKMPYGRLFLSQIHSDPVHPTDYYICFCTRTSVKQGQGHQARRNLPIETFYSVIRQVKAKFVQVGNSDDEPIDLPNVEHRLGIPFNETLSLIANAGMFYGLQSGLRVIAEALQVPIVCYHSLDYSYYDLPLTQWYTHSIFGETCEITDPEQSIIALNAMMQQTASHFEGCKNIIRCKSPSEVDSTPEHCTVLIDWRNLDLELYAKTLAIQKRIRVVLEQ